MAEPSTTPEPGDEAAAASSSGSESLLTVLVALGANALIAVAKSFVAALTGSASMVAEAAHSWSDAGNEVFLLVAQRRAAKPADDLHPLGFGREAYVWSMFAAFGLFTAGAVVSIWHGISSWSAPAGEEVDYTWAYAVLALAFVLEGLSFLQARRQTRSAAQDAGLHPLRFLARTSNPTLRAVYAEDSAALLGILLAAGGIGLHQATGDARWDAAGSVLVGLLLGCVAVFLISRNRDFLVGQAVSPAMREDALRSLTSNPEVQRVTFLHLEFVGPGKIFLIAAVDLTGDAPEAGVAQRLRAVTAGIEEHEHVARAVLTLSVPEDETLPIG